MTHCARSGSLLGTVGRFRLIDRRLLILLFGFGALPGCAQMTRDAITPEVYLSSIELLESGLLEQRMKVDLNVVNPNPYAVTVTGIDFVLKVNGSRLVSGQASDAVRIPGRGESPMSVVARTGLVQVVQQLMRLPGAETLKYELTGDMELGRFLGKTFPFKFEGELNSKSLIGITGGG